MKYYLLDNLAYSMGVEQKVTPGRIHPSPVIELGKPGEWDEKRIQFSSVIYDPAKEKFRMWYLGLGNEPECVEGDGPGCVVHRGVSYLGNTKQGYAESLDGERWAKPALGLAEYNGSRDNNIVPVHPALPGSPMAIYDPEEGDDSHTDKMVLSNGGGASLAFSDDGIHWRSYANGENLYKCGSERGCDECFDLFTQEPYSFVKDPDTRDENRRYLIYTQASSGPPHWVRRTGLAYSLDARRWTALRAYPARSMGWR